MQHYVIKVCQRLVVGQWFSQGTAVSSTNKTDCHDITEILKYHNPKSNPYYFYSPSGLKTSGGRRRDHMAV